MTGRRVRALCHVFIPEVRVVSVFPVLRGPPGLPRTLPVRQSKPFTELLLTGADRHRTDGRCRPTDPESDRGLQGTRVGRGPGYISCPEVSGPTWDCSLS